MSVILFNPHNNSLQLCFITCSTVEESQVQRCYGSCPRCRAGWWKWHLGFQFLSLCFSFYETLLQKRWTVMSRETELWVTATGKSLLRCWRARQGRATGLGDRPLRSPDKKNNSNKSSWDERRQCFGLGCILRPLEDCCIQMEVLKKSWVWKLLFNSVHHPLVWYLRVDSTGCTKLIVDGIASRSV